MTKIHYILIVQSSVIARNFYMIASCNKPVSVAFHFRPVVTSKLAKLDCHYKKCWLSSLCRKDELATKSSSPLVKPEQTQSEQTSKIKNKFTIKLKWISIKMLTMSCYILGIVKLGVFDKDTSKIQIIISETFNDLIDKLGYENKKVPTE